jgi:hypothetical protein
MAPRKRSHSVTSDGSAAGPFDATNLADNLGDRGFLPIPAHAVDWASEFESPIAFDARGNSVALGLNRSARNPGTSTDFDKIESHLRTISAQLVNKIVYFMVI